MKFAFEKYRGSLWYHKIPKVHYISFISLSLYHFVHAKIYKKELYDVYKKNKHS